MYKRVIISISGRGELRLFLRVRTFWATLEKTHMRTLAYQNCINFIHSLKSILMTVKVNYLFAIIRLYTLVQEHVIAVRTFGRTLLHLTKENASYFRRFRVNAGESSEDFLGFLLGGQL